MGKYWKQLWHSAVEVYLNNTVFDLYFQAVKRSLNIKQLNDYVSDTVIST